MTQSSSTQQIPRLFGAAVVVAPVLLLLSTVVYITTGGGVNDGVAGGTIGIWTCFLFVIGYVGIARALEPAAPKASLVLAVLAIVGLMTGYGYNLEAIHAEHLGEDIWSTSFDNPLGYLAFDPWGLFLPLALVLTAFLIWRTPVFPVATAVPLLLGGLLFVPSREAGIAPLAVVADVGLVLGLVPIGLAMLARPQPSAATPDVALGPRDS